MKFRIVKDPGPTSVYMNGELVGLLLENGDYLPFYGPSWFEWLIATEQLRG